MRNEREQSFFRVVIFASVHSQRFALSQYSLGRLSDEQIINIGTDMVRLFEKRYEEETKGAPPVNPDAPPSPNGIPRNRKRLRDL